MLRNLVRVPVRIVVTGSRGKSSLTRLLQAGLTACGLATYARITGVVPRELSPSGERAIRRTSPAHIREMRWWLAQVPPDAGAVVVENSAVSPTLQSFAPDLIAPTLVVWTTLRADHTEVWGSGREGAARALLGGVPRGVPVAGGTDLSCPPLPDLFAANGNALHVPDLADASDHTAANLALAALACELCGTDAERAVPVMASLPPDLADFRVLRSEADELAVAFSANDVDSTVRLFEETGWAPEETTLLYHHRPDRQARLEDFLPWIESRPWKGTLFTRQTRPFFSKALIKAQGGRAQAASQTFGPATSRFSLAPLKPLDVLYGLNQRLFSFCDKVPWNDAIDGPEAFESWFRGRGRVFACGNVAGWPLEFLKRGVSIN